MEGKILAGRYRLLSMLGQGGMGSVWRAEHLTLGTPLAIKLIDSSIAESAEAVARFKREAQSAAELRSVHVVQIIDYGVDDGVPYIAMELLDGESLAARLQCVIKLSPAHTAGVLSQVARALTRAHAAGIVHRDLKPENIYLVPEGDDDIAKVLDFGIAKKLSALSASSAVKTGTGTMLGTPYYMSPEQALGQTNIDHRTDIWSLGIIAFQCLTGERPFNKDTLGALVMAICSDPLPVPSAVASVPPGFDAWFARCAARSLAERFASATEATAALKAICGEPSGRPSTGFTARGDTVTSAFAEPWATAQAGTAADFLQTAVPSSVTIPSIGKSHVRGVAIAVGAVLLFTIAGIFLVRSLMHRGPSMAASAIVASELPSAAAPTTPGNVAIVPAVPSVYEAPSNHASGGATSSRGTNKKTDHKTLVTSPSTSPTSPTPPPQKSAAPPATLVPKRNYDSLPGF